MTGAARIRVGIGGWVFPPWRGTFYPKDVKQADELAYASRQVTAIEINGTFYGAQKPASFRRWHDDTPDDFVFSVKGPRYATHRSDLAEAGPSVERFFNSGVLELRDKLGPILWQFPPFLRFDEAGFATFLDLLPSAIDNRPIRHVVEVRHASFAAPAFADLLRSHGVAVAFVDDAKVPAIDAATTDFVYARLRRCVEDELTGYSPDAIAVWAERARTWSAGTRDCFVYFINGAKVRAPSAAQALIALLS
jgi:uncharacterized protein YecE (DUF72 family)